MDFCRVPAGEFLYGDNQERRRTDGFWIGKAPVTTAAFLAFVRETEYSAHAYYTSKVAPQQLDHPAKFVSWSDALAWCAWASTRAKAKVRLPAEVEWEKAARGTDGRTYPWGREEPTSRYGNLIELGANVKTIGEDAWNYTTPVGKFSPAGDSPYGLIDTCGNVWEWCADSYDVEQEYRVLRGGSFINRSEYVRCAFRLGFDPRFHLVFNGFRVVLNPPSF
jgi:serine/threonine-protein kinase